METFLNIANDHTCASLQKFGATRTPAPPWVAIHRLLIPQQSLSQSADFLIKAFGGEEMAYKIAGGSKWWQVRAGHGVEAEWIVMKEEHRRSEREEKRHKHQMRQESKRSASPKKRAENEAPALPEDVDELDSGLSSGGDPTLTIVHGGAYYWGSINTHRYTIWRFARKMHGRCFAVNYRKAPQYPFPCAIQDILAAYLYLVNPPKDAPHRPVDPKEIIIAGDSAGGGLTWALLQILRDTPGLELPAGAVLISPDVIPAYSFIHKPSSLWPPPPTQLTAEMQNNISIRVKEAVHKMRHPHAEHDSGSDSGLFSTTKKVRRQSIHTSDPDASGRLHDLFAEKEKEKKSGKANDKGPHNQMCVNPSENFWHLEPRSMGAENSTLAQVGRGIQMDVYKEPVVVDTQIQLYCTNGQLCHPWISPILGYLGGLPPLYILAGDDEVLRDEIIYS
ncbi:hypothetical protein A1Q1_02860 [Trichosporon asahii var. asahii CBS 2479]|uniref:Alpha/beta hydrolase fold-3 domain-containing protein n=1 Tax=Trichosporon asahii var. asahii (strain ATCC 90039 / CBS 2479 / JCM 2466 / KCTC 7840 / NBRC 103889/ NCYC 2677 / UAMH 7654) TaxID=1186058 RepID=J5SY62_TRIAS|nr:hypothetical protein A1Q1_02860 [Trichosporon asahii var. asahii CBS 2479]EJT48156.1 hypothetical protein A1Q1_02860 [Trichosporon asahii var. asahii CBS 2479]